MLTTEQINELHRLYWSERWPIRKIERHLKMGWKTIKKYLDAPAQGPSTRERASKLDPFKGHIADWLEKEILASPLRSSSNGCDHSVIPAAPASCKSMCERSAPNLWR